MMKLSKLYVIALLAGTLGVIGCSDDPPSTGNGGTGGTGGVGGIDLGCDEGRCVEQAQATACKDGIQACIVAEAINEEECILIGNVLYCAERGAGGAGGGGGVGGGIDLGCDEGRCVDQAQATACEDGIRACIAAEAINEEECVAIGNFFYCAELGAGGAGGAGGEGGAGGAGDLGCDVLACEEDDELKQQCEVIVRACLIWCEDGGGCQEEDCLGLGLLICNVAG